MVKKSKQEKGKPSFFRRMVGLGRKRKGTDVICLGQFSFQNENGGL
jgi:hypothetical protein